MSVTSQLKRLNRKLRIATGLRPKNVPKALSKERTEDDPEYEHRLHPTKGWRVSTVQS